MSAITLNESQQRKIMSFLRSCSGIYVGNEEKTLRFIAAILWMVRSGAQWELLPASYGQLDSTIIRAQPCAAGAPVAEDTAESAQALGRSRGGFSTKIHIVVDALGNPLDFVLTAGQVHDVTQAASLLQGRRTDYVIADKGYDAATLIELIEQMGAIPVIPARKNRKEPRFLDAHLYKERHLIECFINKIKWFRRIFTRFDKLAKHFLGFLSFVAVLIWLR